MAGELRLIAGERCTSDNRNSYDTRKPCLFSSVLLRRFAFQYGFFPEEGKTLFVTLLKPWESNHTLAL